MSKDVLALDFGTTNSYYCKCPRDQTSPMGVDFRQGRDGLATAILYRKGRPPLVGYEAIEEYGEATVEERAGYDLRTHFKPDIATDGKAREFAADYLRVVAQQAELTHIDLGLGERQVIIGIPSEAKKSFKSALTRIAREAGYGEVTLVDEPKGALLHHLCHKDISPGQAQQGVLVVDFGGGTCDFAFMIRLAVRHSWGNMDLGGRLFDDLFFQWFAEQNPAAVESMEREGTTFFVHACLCREIKEAFSRTMARDRSETVNKAVRHYGSIRGMTWDAFIERAGAYTPSPTFSEQIAHTGSKASGFAKRSESPIDLLEWFKRVLKDGFRKGGVPKEDVRLVILAGGSSQWPFVPDILADVLMLDAAAIVRSDRPYVAISEGLAILPALQRKLGETQRDLRSKEPEFFKTELRPLIDKATDQAASGIASDVTSQLFDNQIRPILDRFRKEGGTVASLKERVSLAAKAFEPKLKELVEHRMSDLQSGLPPLVSSRVKKWLGHHGVASEDTVVAVDDIGARPDALGVELPGFYSEIIDTIGWFAGALMSGIVAMVCGGGGMAILVSGPIGWIIGLIIGVIVAALTVMYGVEQAKKMAEQWKAPGWIIRRALTDGRIAETRKKLRADVKSTASKQLAPLRDKIGKQVREHVDQVIRDRSEISRM